MIGSNFIIKNAKVFLNTMRKVSPENFLPLPRHRKKRKWISLDYDVNDHVYSKSKSI